MGVSDDCTYEVYEVRKQLRHYPPIQRTVWQQAA